MPYAGTGPAACHHHGLEGHLEQVLDSQAAGIEADPLGGQHLGARDPIEQARPLDHDDTLPGFRRDRGSEMVALADRQVTKPPPGVAGLPDVQQDAAGQVHAVDRVAGDRFRTVSQELPELVGEPVPPVLPGQDPVRAGQRVQHRRPPPVERIVSRSGVHVSPFWQGPGRHVG